MKYPGSNRHLFLLLAFVVTASLAGTPAYAQDKAGEIDKVFRDRFRYPSGDLSFRSQDEFELNFLSQDELELKSMEGKTTRYRRAQPFAPTAADLQAFAGRYESDEVGSVFKVVAGQGSLMFHREGSGGKGSELKPVYRDTFQIGPVTVRFVRDGAGKVLAFEYSNPLIRNLRFTRLSDR
jgi:hypothetical protein